MTNDIMIGTVNIDGETYRVYTNADRLKLVNGMIARKANPKLSNFSGALWDGITAKIAPGFSGGARAA